MGLMQVFSTLIIGISVLEFSNASCSKQAQASSLLESVMSPANAERALKILRMAVAGGRAKQNVAEEIPLARLPYPPNAIAAAKQYLPELLQTRIPQRQYANLPVVEVRPPEICPPVVTPTIVTEAVVYPGAPIPQPCGVQPAVASPVVPAAAYYPTAPYYPSAPAPMVNPFLPAASPVSAIAPPTSSLLPPVNPTQVRSNFLRKIPILPPTI